MRKKNTKNVLIDEICDLIQLYVWCTRGSDENDDYDIREEEDFDEFKESLAEILNAKRK